MQTGFVVAVDAEDRLLDAVHPQGFVLASVGDLALKGPDTLNVLRDMQTLVARGRAVCVAGNNDLKLARALQGLPQKGPHVAQALTQIAQVASAVERASLQAFLEGLPAHAILRAPRAPDLVLAHAGIDPAHIGRTDEATRQRCLFGIVHREPRTFGTDSHATDAVAERSPSRKLGGRSHTWLARYHAPWAPYVVYGHTTVTEVVQYAKTRALDTGCVIGGSLTAFAWPAQTITQVAAKAKYVEGEALTPADLFADLPGGRQQARVTASRARIVEPDSPRRGTRSETRSVLVPPSRGWRRAPISDEQWVDPCAGPSSAPVSSAPHQPLRPVRASCGVSMR